MHTGGRPVGDKVASVHVGAAGKCVRRDTLVYTRGGIVCGRCNVGLVHNRGLLDVFNTLRSNTANLRLMLVNRLSTRLSLLLRGRARCRGSASAKNVTGVATRGGVETGGRAVCVI